MDSKPKILLTGFGPFLDCDINYSASCVTIIKDSGLAEELNADIITEVFDVAYDHSMQRLKELWSSHRFFMAVHIGVHPIHDRIVIEKCARKTGYKRLDVIQQCPINGACPLGDEDVIYSSININEIVKKCDPGPFQLHVSERAGLFLCEYIYYISLSHSKTNVIFIHIPNLCGLDLLHSKVNDVVKDIIKLAYLQVPKGEELTDK